MESMIFMCVSELKRSLAPHFHAIFSATNNHMYTFFPYVILYLFPGPTNIFNQNGISARFYSDTQIVYIHSLYFQYIKNYPWDLLYFMRLRCQLLKFLGSRQVKILEP